MSLKLTDFSFHCSGISSLGTQETAKLKLITATFIIPVLFPLLVREYSDFPFWTFGLMGASPENGHTPHGQRSAFQSFNGGGVEHVFKCNRNIIDIKRFLHLMTRTQKHLYRQNITVLSRHIIWNIQIWDLQQCDHIFAKSWCFTEILQEKCRMLQKRSVGSKR